MPAAIDVRQFTAAGVRVTPGPDGGGTSGAGPAKAHGAASSQLLWEQQLLATKASGFVLQPESPQLAVST